MLNDFEAEKHLRSMEAEKQVLGSIMLEPELLHDCYLRPEEFGYSSHKNIMYLFQELAEKEIPIEITAIFERVGPDRMPQIGGIAYLTELVMGVPSTANFTYYQGIVKEYHEKRKTYEIGRKIMQGVFEEDEAVQVRNNAVESLGELDSGGMNDGDGHIGETLKRVYEWMEQDHGEITGAPTGFGELDEILSGLQRQDLVIIGARPSMGKTALAINMCVNYAKMHNGPAGIFSLEMPEEALARRMISNVGNIDAQQMRNPIKNFSGDDWSKSTMAMGSLSNMPLHIFDKAGVDISYIRQKCRVMKNRYPGQHIVIVVDYLQLIIGNPAHRGNRTAEISEISRMLKQIARDMDLTMVALSQLSRGVEQRQDKRPMMSDLRESGQIEQDADVIGFLYRDDYYDKESEQKDIIEVIIAKQRNGPTGTAKLVFAKEFNKFVNIDYQQSM